MSSSFSTSCILPPFTDKYGKTIRTNYDKRIMGLYKFEENLQPKKVYMKQCVEQRTEYDKRMKKQFGY